ncbi:MAG TPA: ATP-binding protein [Bryobacteraceae bacterium]|nr:ATP-binding protein [Bryobacteraceae bacterium]
MEQRSAGSVVRPQDLVWIALFGALAFFGPDRTTQSKIAVCTLGLLQILEPRLSSYSQKALLVFITLKFAVCYAIIYWTLGIQSSYYWVLLFPVISSATTLNIGWTGIISVVASGIYLSFLRLVEESQYIPREEYPELIMRALLLPVVGYLTQELAEANREAARRAEAAAEQLAEANRNLREAEATVRRTERLAALGQLSAGLAHELRNPLGTMKASAEMLAKQVEPANEVAREMAGFISSEVDRTNQLVTRFLDFARPMSVRLEKTDLAQLVDQAVNEIGKHVPPLNVAIYKNYSPDIPPFLLDAQLMERVIYNLLLNAAQASSPGGSITVKTRESEGTVEIAVIDRGSGIEPKHLENIFNPFFTTKSTGVGLGLAIVSKIVDEHEGKIAVESEPGSGTIFRVYLPLRETREEVHA